MELEKLALLTREEIENEINKMCPYPENPENPYEEDRVLHKRVNLRQSLKRLQIEAMLDGKLTVDQVVNQEHTEEKDDDLDLDGIHRSILEDAIKELNAGGIREDIIDKTLNHLELL